MCLDCARFWGHSISKICKSPVLLDFRIWQGRHTSKAAIPGTPGKAWWTEHMNISGPSKTPLKGESKGIKKT